MYATKSGQPGITSDPSHRCNWLVTCTFICFQPRLGHLNYHPTLCHCSFWLVPAIWCAQPQCQITLPDPCSQPQRNCILPGTTLWGYHSETKAIFSLAKIQLLMTNNAELRWVSTIFPTGVKEKKSIWDTENNMNKSKRLCQIQRKCQLSAATWIWDPGHWKTAVAVEGYDALWRSCGLRGTCTREMCNVRSYTPHFIFHECMHWCRKASENFEKEKENSDLQVLKHWWQVDAGAPPRPTLAHKGSSTRPPTLRAHTGAPPRPPTLRVCTQEPKVGI